MNHKYNFINPSTGTHTQNIERMWSAAKWRNKRQRGTAHQHLESYLAKLMWRKTLGLNSPFDTILKAISDIWPQPPTLLTVKVCSHDVFVPQVKCKTRFLAFYVCLPKRRKKTHPIEGCGFSCVIYRSNPGFWIAWMRFS